MCGCDRVTVYIGCLTEFIYMFGCMLGCMYDVCLSVRVFVCLGVCMTKWVVCMY